MFCRVPVSVMGLSVCFERSRWDLWRSSVFKWLVCVLHIPASLRRDSAYSYRVVTRNNRPGHVLLSGSEGLGCLLCRGSGGMNFWLASASERWYYTLYIVTRGLNRAFHSNFHGRLAGSILLSGGDTALLIYSGSLRSSCRHPALYCTFFDTILVRGCAYWLACPGRRGAVRL